MGWLGEAKIHGHFEKLGYFFTVARVGTIKGAATELRISQPSLTVAMRHLEDALGAQLMVRSRQGIRLTLAGARLVKEGEPLMRTLAHLAGSIHADATLLSGTVRCCTHEIVAGVIWPPVMAWAQEHAPDLELVLETTRSTREMIQWTMNLGQDVCIVAEAPKEEAIERVELFHDYYSFFATEVFLKQNAVRTKRGETATVALTKLTQLPMIFPPQVIAGPNVTLDAVIERQQLSFKSRFNIKTLETALALAANALGVALIPRLFAKHALGQGLCELSVPELKNSPLGAHTYHACFRSADKDDLRIKALVSALKKQFGRPTVSNKR